MNSGAITSKTNEDDDVLNLNESKQAAAAAMGNNLSKPLATEPNSNKPPVESKTDSRPEAKVDNKKTKITIELDTQSLDEIKVLTTLGVYDSKEDFIVAAVNEKKDEVMSKIKSVIKKK